MGTGTAIETHYKGHHFSKRLEARWAVFFDILGIPWTHACAFRTELPEIADKWYHPQFWLQKHDCFVEVTSSKSATESREKAAHLTAATKMKTHVLWGSVDGRGAGGGGIYTYYPRYNQDGKLLSSAPAWTDTYQFCSCPVCGVAGITDQGRVQGLWHEGGRDCEASLWGQIPNLQAMVAQAKETMQDSAYWLRKVHDFYSLADSPRILDAYERAQHYYFRDPEDQQDDQ